MHLFYIESFQTSQFNGTFLTNGSEYMKSFEFIYIVSKSFNFWSRVLTVYLRWKDDLCAFLRTPEIVRRTLAWASKLDRVCQVCKKDVYISRHNLKWFLRMVFSTSLLCFSFDMLPPLSVLCPNAYRHFFRCSVRDLYSVQWNLNAGFLLQGESDLTIFGLAHMRFRIWTSSQFLLGDSANIFM